jgi:hypothetical protein
MKITDDHPRLVVSDGCGNVFDVPGLAAAGMATFRGPVLPSPQDWIPMPEGSVLMELPGRVPIGWDGKRGEFKPVDRFRGRQVTAVAMFAAPAYTQLYRAAYLSKPGAPVLPLFAYTPAGWKNGRFWVTALRVDKDVRHDPAEFDRRLVEKSAARVLARHPENRLVRHLVNRCVLEYQCPNAQNFVLGRWECPIPLSPTCSAQCLGCISLQETESVRSTQERIDFVPSVDEILEIAVPHLREAERAMVSFGQGCEGEPLLQAGLIEKAVLRMRESTSRGTIHMNSHGGDPDAVSRLFRAGLDSIRISLNSSRPGLYLKYHRPKGYRFEDVLLSMREAKKSGGWVSLNYFIFPGLTDDPGEMEALFAILDEVRIDCIQMRNLNIDPEWVVRELELSSASGEPVGIAEWMKRVRGRAPWIRFGYFNPPREDW